MLLKNKLNLELVQKLALTLDFKIIARLDPKLGLDFKAKIKLIKQDFKR